MPDPVGAQIRALEPPEIAAQPPAWAGVGPSKEASNQRRTGALNGASGSSLPLAFRSVANRPILRPDGRYGRPPAKPTKARQDGFGTNASLKSPAPSQKLQLLRLSSTANQ